MIQIQAFISFVILDSGIGATCGPSILNTNFKIIECEQGITPKVLIEQYDTSGPSTCFNISITEYDDPAVDNRSGAEKVH